MLYQPSQKPAQTAVRPLPIVASIRLDLPDAGT
jgi:hypothetical protein